MNITKIELKDFRNYEHLKLEFHPKVNIILGNNAQGKTNILESIFLSSLGKSFRTSNDHEMIRFDCKFFRLKIDAEKKNEEICVEMAVSKESKAVKLNGRKIKKISELLESVYIVVFSPEDLKIVKEEPERRRKFIDRELCQIKPMYYSNLSKYKKVLLQRNTLLKENSPRISLLEIWDHELVEYGSKIILQREDFIKKIDKISSKIHKNITNGKEKLHIQYESNVPTMETLEEQRTIFLEKVKNSTAKDIQRRNTSTGPHRDDLKISVNGIDIRKYGSQGQQRTAALSLKLAEIMLIKEETEEDAILLLDDVLSELDEERQNYLINSLSDTQLFITAAEMSEKVKVSLPQGYTFYVNNGQVTQ
ncbi:DNA replication/repair protein RecF [Clostridium aminobutyricum]|uniref:DNA replication and repair protein RecF n=1 Tax=Clostridium aminobutyricum TaxID=33953 RepID=A0A939IIR2_CLOAM|nr:DNA replication/repair protein RecF [Clostridium aminobutyricum]MBN7773336.1 DNA replication/repair protein RecF [Clostridium aminobutyricum]